MKGTIKFTGCKYLDFNDNHNDAEKIIHSFAEGIKVCWRLNNHSFTSELVQFCKKQHKPLCSNSCICKENQSCSHYEEIEHEIDIDTLN